MSKRAVLELLLYIILAIAYFLLALRFLAEPLGRLYTEQPILYAAGALVLITAQGVALEWLSNRLAKSAIRNE